MTECEVHECTKPATEYVEYEYWDVDPEGRNHGHSDLKVCAPHLLDLRDEADKAVPSEGIRLNYQTHLGAN